MTVKQSLINRWQVSGQMSAALEGHLGPAPHFPWLWDWLLTFPMGLTHESIHAWVQITGTDLEGWELELLLALDRLRIKYHG